MNKGECNYIEINTDNSYKPLALESLYNSRENAIESFTSSFSSNLSLAVISCNRLDKTITCIENLLKNTNIPFELVLIDSGSEKEIMEYYQKVEFPNKTIIRITKNINANYSFSVAMQYLKTKYCAIISNDVVVTPNAIENLLTCLESSNKIGWVSPVASNITNYQQVNLPFNNIDEMNENARKYNVSNPQKWCERLSLNPAIFFYRKECIDAVGGFDYGFFHDYADDDIARRINRAGYKTILCRDAWVHHDHPSNKDYAQTIKQNHSLIEGRKKYHEKYHNIDPLNDIRNYEFNLISLIDQPLDKTTIPNILGVDTRCGTPIVEARNRLREYGIMNTNSYAFTTNAKYYYDLQTVCQKVECDRIEYISEYFNHERFDYIILGETINSYANQDCLLSSLVNLLKPNGKLILKYTNIEDVFAIFDMINNNNYELNLSIYPQSLNKALEDVGAKIYRSIRVLHPANEEIDKKVSFIINHINKPEENSSIKDKLFIKEFALCMTKK